MPLPRMALQPEGQCLQMPDEPAGSTFPSRVRLPAYRVQELAGVIFAYLGPEPAPLLPNWDLFVVENAVRDVGFQVLNCNWLQVQENDADPATWSGSTAILPTTPWNAWAARTCSARRGRPADSARPSANGGTGPCITRGS